MRVEDARHGHARAFERAQQPGLAEHVVGRGRQRRARWAAQDEAVGAPAQEEGDVGVALPDRLGLERARAEAGRVENRLERAQDEERRQLERRGLLRGVDDVAHGTILACSTGLA